MSNAFANLSKYVRFDDELHEVRSCPASLHYHEARDVAPCWSDDPCHDDGNAAVPEEEDRKATSTQSTGREKALSQSSVEDVNWNCVAQRQTAVKCVKYGLHVLKEGRLLDNYPHFFQIVCIIDVLLPFFSKVARP